MTLNDKKIRIFNGRRKYLFAALLLILLGFCVYFYWAFGGTQDTLIREQAWEKQQDVGLLAVMVDTLVDLDQENGNVGYSYKDVLIAAVRHIETSYTSTFAQIYDSDMTPLIPQSPGVGGGAKHNPLAYSEFLDAVTTQESGSLSYWYETEQAGGREIHMTFRWVPTDASYTERYLIAVGISKYTVNESLDPKVIYGAAALILYTAAVIVTMVIMMTRLGHIYDSRQGKEKWREDWVQGWKQGKSLSP